MRGLPGVIAVCVAALTAGSAAARGPGVPQFRTYTAPASFGDSAAEPSLGVNPRTGAVMYQAGVMTLRVDGFDRRGPGSATWTDVSPNERLNTGTFDPILEMDQRTGRTWVSHLELACSRMAYTDDDGRTWTGVPVGCSPGAIADHQTVGAGPFPEGTARVSHPSAVYYCANSVEVMLCGVSRDGGDTFGPARPVGGPTRLGTCGIGWGLHVARDGTAYVPPFWCSAGDAGSRMGLYVTEDAGETWRTEVVPGSSVGTAVNGGVATDATGAVYLLWGSGDGTPQVSVSRDKGRTWSRSVDVGAPFGIVNTKFPTAVAGDAGRAAVAFLGSPEPGDDQAESYQGAWHLYVAFTYDGGRTWRTVNATPDSPVQVGAICVSGIACASSRNLADFIDVSVDQRGYVVAAIADGCLRRQCTTADRSARPTIVRQVAGPGLLSRFDRSRR